MKCLVLQTIDLYGTRYKVGQREIPAGHACGAEWDAAVAHGWVQSLEPVVKAVDAVVAEVSDVVEAVSDGVQAFADLMDSMDDMPEIDGQAEVKPVSSRGRPRKGD